MTDQVYRTANGKVIDMGAIIIQNEGTVPVGNLEKVRRQEARNKAHAAAKDKANNRLLKKRIKPGTQPIVPVVPLSETIKRLVEHAKKMPAPDPTLISLPDLSDVDMPAEIGAPIDMTAVEIDDQIQALADSMLNDLSAEEQSEIESMDDAEEAVTELTGLAAALAKVKQSQQP